MKLIINKQWQIDKISYDILNRRNLYLDVKFEPYNLRNSLFEKINLDINEFEKDWFYHEDSLFISESENKNLIISTIGLCLTNSSPSNYLKESNFVRSFNSQYKIIKILNGKIKELCSKPDIYDIDSFTYECLQDMSIGFTHNYIFLIELFIKCYLDVFNVNFKKTHCLKELFNLMNEEMYKRKQNNSIFHAYVVNHIKHIVSELKLPDYNFKEQFIKYNEVDEYLINIEKEIDCDSFLTTCYDLIFVISHNENDCYYFNQNLYNELLNVANTEEEKQNVIDNYYFLLE